MTAALVTPALLVSGLLFALGLIGVMVRRNLIFVLLSLEIMFNAAALALIAAGARTGSADGQVLFLFVLAVAAAEAAVGLALVFQVNRRLKTIDGDVLNTLRG
jgi:NADH-quinone oxidoreductase subunit K